MIQFVAVALFVFLNAFATFVAATSKNATTHQKIFQILFIWIIPILGAFLTLAVHRERAFTKDVFGNPGKGEATNPIGIMESPDTTSHSDFHNSNL